MCGGRKGVSSKTDTLPESRQERMMGSVDRLSLHMKRYSGVDDTADGLWKRGGGPVASSVQESASFPSPAVPSWRGREGNSSCDNWSVVDYGGIRVREGRGTITPRKTPPAL